MAAAASAAGRKKGINGEERSGRARPRGSRCRTLPGPPRRPTPTHSVTRDTAMLTGTLRSLKAVVMKQPKVSAAITLSEKAKSELARDSTVFISPPALPAVRAPGLQPLLGAGSGSRSAGPEPRQTRAAAAPSLGPRRKGRAAGRERRGPAESTPCPCTAPAREATALPSGAGSELA